MTERNDVCVFCAERGAFLFFKGKAVCRHCWDEIVEEVMDEMRETMAWRRDEP